MHTNNSLTFFSLYKISALSSMLLEFGVSHLIVFVCMGVVVEGAYIV